MVLRVFSLTTLALIAFAANSVLNRMALAGGAIDPVSFAQIRLFAGALALAPLLVLARRKDGAPLGDLGALRTWLAPAALFIYAVGFSLSYVSLDAGAGALILFASVQITMIGMGLARGLKPMAIQWLGLALAFAGLVYLLAPGVNAPAPLGAALMAVAGVAWGGYTLLGRGAARPATLTARNFALTIPLALALFAVQPDWGPNWASATPTGIMLAIASGAITSGLGYVIWYATLRDLATMTASVCQLAVPAIAAFGGALFLAEPITARLALASALILGGIFAVIRAADT